MGTITAGIRCQHCGGLISMGRFLEKCPGCGAQGNHAYAVRQRHLQERPHRKRGHTVALFAVIGVFTLIVAASQMVGSAFKNQLSEEVLLPEEVVRISRINKDIK